MSRSYSKTVLQNMKFASSLFYIFFTWKLINCDKLLEINTHKLNSFVTLKTKCVQKALIVKAMLSDPFDGSFYARGYPLECRALGNNSREVTLVLDVAECGVKMTEKENGEIEYETTVNLQYDRTVQQAFDEQIPIKCSSPPISEIDSVLESSDYFRKGRYLETPSDWRPMSSQPLNAFHCWLDILRGDFMTAVPVTTPLKVGEIATLAIKVKERPGIQSKVISCIGHDGTEENVQLLTDQNGCSIDDNIMSALTESVSIKSGTKMFQTSFSAFKFPERQYLHIKCIVLICERKCPLKTCKKKRNGVLRQEPNRTGSDSESPILDVIEVFNAVEVEAPGIEFEYLHLFGDRYEQDAEVVCTSPTRLIIIFGFLVGVFCIASLIAAIFFFWSRLQRHLRSDSESVIRFPYTPCESYT